MIVFAAIVPHPLESIPGITAVEDCLAIEKTMQSLETLREDLERADPEIIVVISPHAPLEPFEFMINSASKLKGNFSQFGLDEVYSYENDLSFADKLAFAAVMNELPTVLHESFLDHGTLIPLYHLAKNIKAKVVQLSFSLMDYEKHYRYGEVIHSLASMGGKRVAIIASGCLSHKLAPNSPAGFSSQAQEFDRKILHFLGSDDVASIMGLRKEELMEVAECGLRSIVILLGIVKGEKYDFNLLSYEAPTGIGYLTARLI